MCYKDEESPLRAQSISAVSDPECWIEVFCHHNTPLKRDKGHARIFVSQVRIGKR